jgi:hypothetical protein
MSLINWEKIGFKKNPFNVIPSIEPNNLIWANFKDNKKRFDDIISSSLTNSESKVILNVSRYGGGKTHTSYYYSQNSNLPEIDESYEYPLHVIINTPKEGKEAVNEFFIKTIEGFSLTSIEEVVYNFRNSFENESNSLNHIQKIANSEDLGRIIWYLGDKEHSKIFEAERVLFGNETSKIKDSLKLRRGIKNNSDKIHILSSIIQLLSLYDQNSELDSPRRIFIWLDELESLVYYSSKEYKPFTQAIRELFDLTPKYLNIFMNFSFAEPGDMQDIELVIGEALIDRVTEQFVFMETDIQEGKEYVKDLFQQFSVNEREFFPFTENSLEKILELGPHYTGKPIMPRTINRWCLHAIKIANEKGYFNKDTPEPIDKDTVEELDFSNISL